MAYVKAAERSKQLVAAARVVLMREGVGAATLRAVAAEADVRLSTLQHVFPSKELLLRAVIEDVVEEIATVLGGTANVEHGLNHAIRQGLQDFWDSLVKGDIGAQLMQYELIQYSLRTPGLENLARWQYERYCRIVAAWCQEAAQRAGETCAVPFDVLARVLIASVDGLIVQRMCDPDGARSQRDLGAVVEMLVLLATPTTAPGADGP